MVHDKVEGGESPTFTTSNSEKGIKYTQINIVCFYIIYNNVSSFFPIIQCIGIV
jgi:hypothetical protein